MGARTLVVAIVATLPMLAACSSDTNDQEPDPAASAAAVGWSPCDGLTAESVEALVGQPVTEVDGTADQPRCTFTPVEKGGAAYGVSYLFFDGGLDEALAAMGAAGSTLEPVEIEGAEAARIAVDARDDGLLVTGFVQTEGLVQSVNAVQLTPYDEQQVVSGTRRLLATLAERAPEPKQK